MSLKVALGSCGQYILSIHYWWVGGIALPVVKRFSATRTPVKKTRVVQGLGFGIIKGSFESHYFLAWGWSNPNQYAEPVRQPQLPFHDSSDELGPSNRKP